jgi:hypothetical protein
MSGVIQPRVSWEAYCALPGTRVSHLKELRRSPLHYRHMLANPTETTAMRLGTAAHTAVLEPERFQSTYAFWTRRTDSGRLAPRTGKHWDAFVAENPDRLFLSDAEAEAALTIQRAIRSNSAAMRYLGKGEPEVTMQWDIDGHACKGRMDWLTHEHGRPIVVGLKTARDARPFLFGSQAAKLAYHFQWAYYFDGFRKIRGEDPRMVEIVVESKPPHAVAVYNIPADIIDQGRDEYLEMLALLQECQRKNEWPGPVIEEQDLTLPSWVYESSDDLTDLGLEA